MTRMLASIVLLAGAATGLGSQVDQGRVMVDGAPYFPLGTYVHNLTVENWDYLAAAGYNHVLTYTNGHTEVWYNTSGFDTTQVFLDAAAARNMRVILSLKDFYNATKHPGIKAVVSDTVDRFKNHTALLGWYLNDEYHSSELPLLKQMYQLVKGIDPDHITYAVEDSKQLGVLADFYGTADVFGVDPYPWKNVTETTTLASEVVALQGVEEAFGNKTNVAVCTVAQAFSWTVGCTPEREWACAATFPPEPVLLAMSVLEPVLGSVGLVHYSFDQWTGHGGATHVSAGELAKRKAAVTTVMRQMKALADSVFLPRSHRLALSATDPNVKASQFSSASAADGSTILIVNAQSKATTVVISVPDSTHWVGALRNWSVSLEPWEVLRQDEAATPQ